MPAPDLKPQVPGAAAIAAEAPKAETSAAEQPAGRTGRTKAAKPVPGRPYLTDAGWVVPEPARAMGE